MPAKIHDREQLIGPRKVLPRPANCMSAQKLALFSPSNVHDAIAKLGDHIFDTLQAAEIDFLIAPIGHCGGSFSQDVLLLEKNIMPVD